MFEPVRAVTFFCPVFVTGGTEAIHQAAAAMRREGVPAQIAYHGAGIAYARDGLRIRRVDAGAANICQSAFAAYDPEPAREIPLTTDHLVIVPELNLLDCETFSPARFGIWWLSVDNAFNHVPQLADRAFSEKLFSQDRILHLYQSEYARRFLLESGASMIRRLTDITNPVFTQPASLPCERGNAILFNRKKGLDLAQAFFSANTDLMPHALDGMSTAELQEIYRRHAVYVDFGSLPGKDRMPREAAASGCVVFVHDRGAGRELGDFPLRSEYKFNVDDVASGHLADRIRKVLAAAPPHVAAQRHFRITIADEEAGFIADIRQLVAALTADDGAPPDDDLAAAAPASPAGPAALAGPWPDHADRHCIWVVSPKGYTHNRAFDEVALALSAAFAERGGSAPVVHHPSEWAGRVPIVLGAHLLSPAMALVLPEGSVLYNFEQVDRASGWMNGAYFELMRRHAVLDYSHRNLAALRGAGVVQARLLPLGHVDALERIAPAPAKDIDVLFYGSLNERRAAVLEALQAAGAAVIHLFDVYGVERDEAVSRAKIVLNLHHYEAAVFESARVSYLLANGACVVTEGVEGDPDLAPYQGGLAVCGYGEIVALCMLLLREDAVRAALGERGRALMRAHRQADRLAELFAPG